MSPSWIKSLRGHGRSRSESTSSTLSDASLSTTSSSSSSSLASIVQTPTARKSFDDNKENTPIHHGSNSSLRRSRSSSNGIKESRSNLSSLINICKSPSKSSRTSPSPEDTDMLDPPLPEPPLQEDQPFELESTGQASPSLSPDRAAAAAAAAAGGGGTDLSPVASSNSSTRSSFDTRRSEESESSVTTASSSASSPSSLAAAHNGTKFDIDACINKLLKVGYAGTFPKRCALTNGEISTICTLAREIVANQPMLLEVDPGVKVVGDIHGQYHDLLRLFNVCGFPPKSNYLFLGDYVDRGPQGLETILLLLCYKIKHPTKFNLLRGNHEAAAVTRVYGFFDECRRRTGGDVKIWKTFIDLFNCLPVAAIIAGKIFCVHGGLSPQLACMDQIRQLERPCDVTESGLLNDLLWSDPSDSAVDWEPNDRGVSWAFSKGVLEEFLQKHDLDLVCRGHMVVEDGYEFWHDRQLLTVFSAPNYVSQFDNMAAVLSVSEKLLCSFQLLEPLDGPELKREMQRCQQKHAMQNAQAIQQRLSSNLRR